MIFIISGESHTGKSLLAQNLLAKTSFPYLSLDLVKMGFVRLKNPPFKVDEDKKIKNFFAPFLDNFIQTALENKQNYIIEGVYFRPKKLQKWLKNENCKILFLLFSKVYIKQNYALIYEKESVIEQRLKSEFVSVKKLIKDHQKLKKKCKKFQLPFLEIKENYENEIQKALNFLLTKVNNAK